MEYNVDDAIQVVFEESTSNMEYNVDDAIQVIFDGKDAHNWKVDVKMALITKEIENVMIDIKNYIKESDADVDGIVRECRELCGESQGLIEEMEACKHEIEEETMAEVLKSIENHDYIIEELATVQFSINAICSIVTCSRLAREFEEHNARKNYHRAMETILELLEILENPVAHHTVLSMCVNFKNSATIAYENLLEFLYNLWHQMVTWSTKLSDSGVNTITININMSDLEATFDALYALLLCKKLHEKVKEFSIFLLEEILIPIIHQECTVNYNTDESITITVKTKSSKKPAYDRVIGNIRELFNHLSSKLKIELPDDETVMKIIGKNICEDFSNILVKDCLIDTIPHNINELQSYGMITSEIENFQQFLTVLNFFPNENFSILQYINNIDMLFAEKTSQHFLETARAVMLKDLSSTMSIGVETIPDDTPTTSTPDENWEEALQVFHNTIPKSLFYFPRCMISKTAQELLDLVYTMMEQAVQCSDVVCKRLYLTSRLVFELYDSVVPYHHENFLQNIPQYVALFHNNCMYLSHNLLTLGDKWTILLEGRKLASTVSYLDLVHKLRDLAHKHLTVHMQQQRKQIMDNIRGCDLNCIVVKDVLSDNAEQALRQCLRQLQMLKNVWIGVFPSNVFTGLMATLVNMFVDEIIHRVCTVEDISAEMASQLTDIYTIVVKKAPNLFQNPTDIEARVKCWVKLQELILVLGGSLKDIEKRWAEGKGPLALHFRTEELRNLVKALFQNTQFRANLLSKIK